jgi:hypothetical protein
MTAQIPADVPSVKAKSTLVEQVLDDNWLPERY